MVDSYKGLISFVWVSDLDVAKKFYTETLGLSVEFESGGWVELSVPGTSNSYLALNHWKDGGPLPVNHYITFGVANLEEFKSKLAQRAISAQGEIIQLPEDKVKMFKFLDPDGNTLTAAQSG